jgi:hypothetical protein
MFRIHDSQQKVVHRFVILLMAGGMLGGASLEDASGQRQTPGRPGPWRVLLEDSRPSAPVSLSVGLVGGRFVSEWEQRSQRRERDNVQPTEFPMLVIQCVRGATEFFFDNAPLNLAWQGSGDADSAFRRSRQEPRPDNHIVLVLDNRETIELLPWNPPLGNRRLYLPDPFDLVRKLMGHEMLWVYWTIPGGEPPSAEFMAPEAAMTPDVIFELPGLRDLLHQTEDPCDWLL